MENKSVVLLSFGDASYGKWAFNLALSIKKHNANIPIHLIHDSASVAHLTDFHFGFFDRRDILADSDLVMDGKFCPAKIKTSYYKYLKSEHNIYLDVDAVCMRDLAPLFEDCISQDKPYLTQVWSTHNIKEGYGKIKDMAWATAQVIWDHYKLSDDDILPATQSSFAYIRKCAANEALFLKMGENLSNAIPLEQLTYKWGGSMPDELILNVTLAQMGVVPTLSYHPIYFSNDYNNDWPFINSHYLIGIFGAKGMTNLSILDYYDRIMHNYCREHYGINHYFKAHQLLKNKFAARR